MLHYLATYLQAMAAGTEWAETLSPLRVFRYITFRSVGAAVTALLLSWWLGPRVILWLKQLKFGQSYSDKAEEAGGLAARILDKKGTPTMGGVLIVTVVDLSALLWAQWNHLILLTLLTLVVLAGLGFYDDYLKVTERGAKGARSHTKLWVQGGLSLFLALYLLRIPELRVQVTQLVLPFYKHPVEVGVVVGVIITVLTLVGSSNSVNLTDGLDGLAIGCTVIVTSVFFIVTYIASNVRFAEYLHVPHVPGAGELTVFCAAVIGAGLGFLWFNCHPARVFMGDTGSLALGGALGVVAVLVRQPLLLVIAGGVFVIEAGSVILQTSWFKFTRKRYGEGRRIFRMAPLHHHFEKMGWYESQVVTRFYILCILCAVVALGTLKLR